VCPPNRNLNEKGKTRKTTTFWRDSTELAIIKELSDEFNKEDQQPFPATYITGLTIAIDEVIHGRRPITHLRDKVSPYAYGLILDEILVPDKKPKYSGMIRPAKLRQIKAFQVSNSRFYAVALIVGNHIGITDCYSLTFVHNGQRWMVVDFYLVKGANEKH
jgi:hypothetical protein